MRWPGPLYSGTATIRAAMKKEEARNQLIGPKREQNVMIGLAQIKMSEDDLLDAILKMDDKVRSLSLSLSIAICNDHQSDSLRFCVFPLSLSL